MSNKIKITVMGSGGSGGVPYAGNIWGKCDPANPKNHRLRPSILIQKGDTNIVIDTGPDFRQQINQAGLQASQKIAAVLYTHSHVDHVLGLDDLRAFYVNNGKTPVNVYADEETMKGLTHYFRYAFTQLNPIYPPTVIANNLPERLKIDDLEFLSIRQIHGDIETTGFRVGDFAYCTDINEMPPESLEKLKGIKTWIVGAFYNPDGSGQVNHAGINKIREWVDYLKPEMTYLTHLTASADYDTMCSELPANIRPAYDGLVIEI